MMNELKKCPMCIYGKLRFQHNLGLIVCDKCDYQQRIISQTWKHRIMEQESEQ